MFSILFVLMMGQAVAAPAPPPIDVTKVTASQPTLVAEIDTGKVKGEPVGISWNTDGTLYMRVSQVDVWGNERASHYLIQTRGSLPAKLNDCNGVPQWAAAYWMLKSQTFSPGDASFKIEIERRTEIARTTNTPNAGGLAGMSSAALPGGSGGDKGGEGQTAAQAMDAAAKGIGSNVVTYKAKGQIVGEWTNTPPQPGMRFGWAPAGAGALAYVGQNKKLTLLDKEGRKLEVPATSDVLLPAWSPDGKQIAFLQKKDKKKYSLMIVDVKAQ